MKPEDTCLTCAWLSPCKKKCFNPHFVVMSNDNILPCSPSLFCCVRFESKNDREKPAQ